MGQQSIDDLRWVFFGLYQDFCAFRNVTEETFDVAVEIMASVRTLPKKGNGGGDVQTESISGSRLLCATWTGTWD
jgi:hypothetical protein